MAKIIFENDLIKVTATGHDYDFIAMVENKTNKEICVHYDEPFLQDNYDPMLIGPNDWIGILADEEGRNWIKAFKEDWFYICGTEDESDEIIFRDDLEDIQKEVDRIVNEYEFKKKSPR